MQKVTFIVILLMCTAFLCRLDAAKPVLKTTVNSVNCYGKSDGSIFFEYTSNPVVTINFSLMDSANKSLLNFPISHDTSFQINHLFPGKYIIHYDYNDKPVTNTVIVQNKSLLKANIIKINKLSGEGTKLLAVLEVDPTGGNPPYAIQWSENTGNQQGKIAKDLPQGIYRCIINDANNCGPVSATFFLFDQEIEKYNQKTKSNR
jgi:hypothetical protein